jgi:hypothetical protein
MCLGAGCSQELETRTRFRCKAPNLHRVLVPCGVLDAGMRVDAGRRHELDRCTDIVRCKTPGQDDRFRRKSYQSPANTPVVKLARCAARTRCGIETYR